jgi:hypothetical protein
MPISWPLPRRLRSVMAASRGCGCRPSCSGSAVEPLLKFSCSARVMPPGFQVAEYYGGITGLRLPPQLQRELGKPMAAHLSIKAGLYASYTLLHQAAVFIADDECGQQIACLQVRA